MTKVEISYNPYKMKTKILVNGVDVCSQTRFQDIKRFIEQNTPLQTWIEPLPYLSWKGLVNEIFNPEVNDEAEIVFSGRKIDYKDLKLSLEKQNKQRPLRAQIKFHFSHREPHLDDKRLSKNIDEVVAEIRSDRFRELVESRLASQLKEKYNDLEKNYKLAKENDFYIVFTGVYSSGKSTLINALIRHDILPMSSKTCTSKNCRIRHDDSLGAKISLTGFDINKKVVVDKTTFDNDGDCKQLFMSICPLKGQPVLEEYSTVDSLEIGVDLSHLYPKSVSKDKFNLVLIDTPGMDSAQSSENGINHHAEIALEAISMENKPMIILCANATKYEEKSIGEFMSEIIEHTKKENGFNDRFLFLMNQSDSLNYSGEESAEDAKAEFQNYLTDSTKWNIEADEDELKALAEDAARFIPRVFMTSAGVAYAIQQKAYEYTPEERRNDKVKASLHKIFSNFKENVCDYEFLDYYLSEKCDNPSFRVEEIKGKFETAHNKGDEVEAVRLQCGIVAVEDAIKDYIERYAYPIKVRNLLETFEDILADVNSFNHGIVADLQKAEKSLGEKESERREEQKRKSSTEEKLAVLSEEKAKVDEQLKLLDSITFDSNQLMRAATHFQEEIEKDSEVKRMRQNPKISTGQKTTDEVDKIIKDTVQHIKDLFAEKLKDTNDVLISIRNKHDDQIRKIYAVIENVISNLEAAGVFEEGEYEFKRGVLWRNLFAGLNSDAFEQKVKNSVVKKRQETAYHSNWKKDAWKTGNIFQKFASIFLKSKVEYTKYHDGYFSAQPILVCIDEYYVELVNGTKSKEKEFKEILNESKTQARILIEKLFSELTDFTREIKMQRARLESLSSDLESLQQEKQKCMNTQSWLMSLVDLIEEGI